MMMEGEGEKKKVKTVKLFIVVVLMHPPPSAQRPMWKSYTTVEETIVRSTKRLFARCISISHFLRVSASVGVRASCSDSGT